MKETKQKNFAVIRFTIAIFIAITLVLEVSSQTKFLKTEQPINNQYIVVFKDEPFRLSNDLNSAVDLTANDLAKNYGGEIGYIYKGAIKGFSIRTSEKSAIAISKDERVKYVTEDGEASLSDTQLNPPYNLDRIDQRDLPLNQSYTYDSGGAANVFAYVIDSGIHREHVQFGGLFNNRVFIGADFVGDGRNGADCNGHGTHVAGILGGTTYGVAKNVKIFAVRVFGCGNNAPISTIIAGVDWVRVNRVTNAPVVANMSLGGNANQALDDAVRNLIASGVTTVVAAGNDSADANNFSPARVREAITVGATDSADNRASFSNFGTAVDVFAPGVGVISSWWDGGTMVLDGTSMSTPHVTGVVALYLQGNTFASPAEVQDVIVANSSMEKISNPGSGSPNHLLYVGQYSVGGGILPLYRYYSSVEYDHFYTSTWSELGAGLHVYAYEKVQCKIYRNQIFGTVPLYRYYSQLARDHLYTTDFNELGYGAYGYAYEGIVGYVSSSQQPGLVPIYRYWHMWVGDHFYTTDFSELGYGGNGWDYEGIIGYAIP